MEKMKGFLEALGESFDRLKKGNAGVGKPISIGDRHVVPLCELKVAWGAGGGEGEGEDSASNKGKGKGRAQAGAGGAKATPVALLVIENGKVRLETLGD